MAAPRVSKIHKVSLDGVDYGTKTATLEPGGFKKETQYASGKISGRSWDPMCSRVTVTFEMITDTDVEAIRNFSGRVEFENDIGHMFAIANADVVEPPRIVPAGGVEVVIEGDPAEQI